ncbi:hypothetical protein B1R32_103261 [Abditibacterium utsteinense]|uniref:Uncharacterized protein n=1 Tax=Abditibacterium utsteinense TaxID=1960156 RepID=A0A2S8SW11_9BACT|nr:hypothetical protein [Abditibacterium utsteinense]PQV64991.1 hypothetical protein B1R32_103261 [Abditibacterium utsteinense]
MKIKKCPSCVQYIHFDQEIGVAKCWNCGAVTDFSKRPNLEHKIWRGVDSRLSVLLSPWNHFKWWNRWSQVAFAVALPSVIIMLLICNSVQIHIVHDAAVPFLWREMGL